MMLQAHLGTRREGWWLCVCVVVVGGLNLPERIRD